MNKYQVFESLGLVNENGDITRLCTSCRNTDWLKENERGRLVNDRYLANLNGLARIKEELSNIFSLVIVDKDGNIFNKLRETLSVRQTVRPKEIVFVYDSFESLEDVSKILSDFVRGTTTKFSAIRVYDKTNREKIDEGVKRITGLYYTVVENGDIVDSNLFSTLLDKIEKELAQIIYIEPIHDSKLTGMTVHRVFHNMVNGNCIVNIEEKVKEALEAEPNNIQSVTSWSKLHG